MTKKSAEKFVTHVAFKDEMDLIHKKFDSIDKKFDGIDQRFDGIDKRFDGIDKKFDGIDQRFGGIDQRMDSLDNKIDRVTLSLLETKDDVRQIKETIDTKMATKADIRVIIDTIDAFTKKVTVQETRALANTHRLNELEPKVENHELRLTALESLQSK